MLAYKGVENLTSMVLPVNGTMHVTTMGWKFSSLGSLIALLPITATFLLSILALLLPWSLQQRAGSLPSSADERIVFDPSSIMSIISASATGGVTQIFRGLRHTPEPAEDEDAHFLSIGLTDDKKIGFVEPGTHSTGIPYRAQTWRRHLWTTTSRK